MAVAHRRAGSGPVQKREVALVKQERGAGPREGAGNSPAERWVGRGSALEGLGRASSGVCGKRGVLREKAIFGTKAPARVLSPQDTQTSPGVATVD